MASAQSNARLQPEADKELLKRTGDEMPGFPAPLTRRRPRAPIESLTRSEVTWHITVVASFTCTSVAAVAWATYSMALGATVLAVSGTFVVLGLAAIPFIKQVVQMEAIDSVRASIKTGDIERIEEAVSHAKAVGVEEDKLQSLPEVRLALKAGIGQAKTQQACRHLESVVRCALAVHLLAEEEANQLLGSIAGTPEAAIKSKVSQAAAATATTTTTKAAASPSASPSPCPSLLSAAARGRGSTCSSVVSGCSAASSSAVRRLSSSSSCCSSSLSSKPASATSATAASTATAATAASRATTAATATTTARATTTTAATATSFSSSSSSLSKPSTKVASTSSTESLGPLNGRSRRATVGRARAMLEAALEVPEVENLRAAIALGESVALDGMEMELARSVLRREERKRMEGAEKELAAAFQSTDATRLRRALEGARQLGVGASLLARGEQKLRALGAHQCLPLSQYQSSEAGSTRRPRKASSSSEASQTRSHSPAPSLASLSTASTSSRKVSWALQEGDTLEWDIVEMPPELL